MKYTINIVTRLQDNGDGGYTMYCYNSNDELLDDHPMARGKYNRKTGKYEKIELTEEQKEDILNGEDEYENGYIGSETIEIEIVDGVARLVSCFSIDAGQ